MQERILVVDDDKMNLIRTKKILEKCYDVLLAESGADALEMLEEEVVDLVLLDIEMPGMNGIETFEQMQKFSVKIPVIFLTASGDEYSVVTGLELGAEDYISKPFRPRELVSRMRSVLRRAGKSGGAVYAGDLKVDTEKGVVTRSGEELFLSALEYRLFLVFLNNRGKVLSRGQLLEDIWDIAGEYVNDNTLTVYIKRLRDKIERDPQNPEIIKTVRGLGYRMEV